MIINSLRDAGLRAGHEGAGLYDRPLLVMVGVLAVGFVANLLVRPVNRKWHEPEVVAPSHPDCEHVDSVDSLSAREVWAKASTPRPHPNLDKIAHALHLDNLHLRERLHISPGPHPMLPSVLAVITVGGLVYGLAMTAMKAVALFGG